jgi:hypothetical protein
MARFNDFGKAMLAYRNRPEGEPEPVQTNWSTVAANDNNPEDVVDLRHERDLRMTPSVDEIMHSVAMNEVERNEAGQVVRIGKIRFSDGTQTEKADALGIDGDVITIDARMPVGAMLGTREKSERAAGGAIAQSFTKMSNNYFADLLGTGAHRYLPRTVRRNGTNRTAEQSREDLAQAIANTATMPNVKRYPDALPCGQKNAADAFLGMRITPSGKGGSMAWDDLATKSEARRQWREVLRDLRDEDRAVLDVAMEAKNMREIGITLGAWGKTAERKGKRALIAANDNIAAAIKKYVA